jgi:hypothetical protein
MWHCGNKCQQEKDKGKQKIGCNRNSINSKALVEGSHETSSKLLAAIREDLLQDSVKAEYVGVVDVRGIFGSKVRLTGHEVALIQIVVDINADGVKAV